MEYVGTDRRLMDSLMNLRDHSYHTFLHSINVFHMSAAMGLRLRLKKDKLFWLGMAGLYHDIGKKAVPTAIINKEGPLEEKERAIMDSHTWCGYYEAVNLGFPTEAAHGILTHHERGNGSGYPNGLSMEDIPLFGRVIAVVDVFDAVTSIRPYRKPLPNRAAISLLTEGGSYDAGLVRELIYSIKDENILFKEELH